MAIPLLSEKPARTLIGPSDIDLLSEDELRRYLLDISPEDRRQSGELWKKYAGRKELIDTTAGRRSYRYDTEGMNYYQETRMGERLVPPQNIKMDVNRFALGVQSEQRQLMNDLMNGIITPQEWYDRTIRLMKLSYLASVDVARGSGEEMDDEEKDYWLLVVLLLFLLLNDFVDAIIEEEIPINGRIPIYAGLRGSASRSVYENWRLYQAKRLGYDEARRVLGVAEHCEETDSYPGCVEEAEKGWIRIEDVIPIGGCTCHDNCKCSIMYRKKRRLL